MLLTLEPTEERQKGWFVWKEASHDGPAARPRTGAVAGERVKSLKRTSEGYGIADFLYGVPYRIALERRWSLRAPEIGDAKTVTFPGAYEDADSARHAASFSAPDTTEDAHKIVGNSDVLRYVMFQVDQVAPTNATVLLLGDTGTGKELVARAIHHRSARRGRPLVVVNCAALPATLIESELFGRERGAFTGAHASQIGHFEMAHRGTILLDEIGELPLELQPKLLRVLQEGQLQRLGSPRVVDIDVRVIAATNRDLSEDLRQGRFRSDLFYRLNVFPLTLPSLRDRQEDIPALVHHLVKRLSRTLQKRIDIIPRAVIEALQRRDWPGNIRELENVSHRAIILSPDTTLSLTEGWMPARGSAPSAGLVPLVDLDRPAYPAGPRGRRLAYRGQQRRGQGARHAPEHPQEPHVEAGHPASALDMRG